MGYKKIELAAADAKSVHGKTRTLSAIKKVCSEVKKDFSEGTNNMADIWVECDARKNGRKAQKLKEETIAMAKNITSGFKKSFKGITAKAAIRDISYELGGVLKKTRDALRDMLKDIKGG